MNRYTSGGTLENIICPHCFLRLTKLSPKLQVGSCFDCRGCQYQLEVVQLNKLKNGKIKTLVLQCNKILIKPPPTFIFEPNHEDLTTTVCNRPVRENRSRTAATCLTDCKKQNLAN